MTTDEQAPVLMTVTDITELGRIEQAIRCEFRYVSGTRCNRLPRDVRHLVDNAHFDHEYVPPAPEETVKTTEERPCEYVYHDGTDDSYICGRPEIWHGLGTHFYTPPPAPEPAGEAQPYWCGHDAHVPGDCPWAAPSSGTPGAESAVTGAAADATRGPESNKSGTPGLTEAQWHREGRSGNNRGYQGWAWEIEEKSSSTMLIVPDGIEAAIAAEARAPLEARVAELESMLRQMWAAGEVDGRNALIDRAEDAERQLEGARQAIEGVILGAHYDDCECGLCRVYRAINPPASTAAEERGE